MWLKKIIFTVFILLFWVAIFCSMLGYKSPELIGEYEMIFKPHFSKDAFINAEYQDMYAEYLRTNNPVYSLLIKTNNQTNFWAFHQMPPGGTIEGKNNVLLPLSHIKAFYGEDYMGEFAWNYYMDIFGFVSDTLHKLNKPMLYVNVGGKPRVMEDAIPDEFRKSKPDSTNNNLYLRKFKTDKRLDYIDLGIYFANIVDTCKIELYPDFSTHFSMYSVYLTDDSIAKRINMLLPHYEAALPVLLGFDVSKNEKDIEFELLRFLNMFWTYPIKDNHYPILKFVKKTNRKKPRVFVIGDSFGQMVNDFGYLYESFDDSSVFIRYNAEYKFKNSDRLININDNFDYWNEFNKADAVIFISSELNLSNFGFTFFEKAYDHFKGIDSFIDHYHTKSVIRTQEGNRYVFTIKKGVGQGTYLKNRNINLKHKQAYKLSYMEKGIGEMVLDFYPDNMPSKIQVYDSKDWKQYTWEFTTIEENFSTVLMFRMFMDYKETIENEMQFKNFKLEEVK